MANSLEYGKKYLPIIDDIYKDASVTEVMDTAAQVDFTNTNEVKILKVSTTGLGDYSRTDGYPKGDITAAWEAFLLTEERGKEIGIDRMDNEEMLANVFGSVTGNFIREQVAPELDAYRFAKYASSTGVSSATPAILTKDTIIAAIDEAVRQMDADEVPMEGRRLYINSDLKPVLNQALNRQWASDGSVNTVLAGYNNMPITYVPKSRFYTSITLNDGSEAWGYKKSDNGKDINFMIIYPAAIIQVKKIVIPKVFTPDENQFKDEWKFQFRMYHDAFVYENKAKGIYVHSKASA